MSRHSCAESSICMTARLQATWRLCRQLHLMKASLEPKKSKTNSLKRQALGWAAPLESLNYEIAAHNFEACWEAAMRETILEMGAFHGWNWARRLPRSRRERAWSQGEGSAGMEDALNRGGRGDGSTVRERPSSGCGMRRCRSADGRSRTTSHVSSSASMNLPEELDRGNRFERWCCSSEQLSSDKHKTDQ